jgi:hypothetical protein
MLKKIFWYPYLSFFVVYQRVIIFSTLFEWFPRFMTLFVFTGSTSYTYLAFIELIYVIARRFPPPDFFLFGWATLPLFLFNYWFFISGGRFEKWQEEKNAEIEELKLHPGRAWAIGFIFMFGSFTIFIALRELAFRYIPH